MQKPFLLCLMLLLFNSSEDFCFAKKTPDAYQTEILAYREKYKNDLLEDERAPIDSSGLEWISFFPINKKYVVQATFTPVADSDGFDMHTHSGKIKKYVVYGKLEFTLLSKPHILFLYQGIELRKKAGFENHLFLPFTDLTSGQQTYGGGRYLDFETTDIKNGSLLIDFNKAYNPYCAYKGGYSCPIPPKENDMKVAIKAGEKRFGKEPKEE
jgi:uncharacterized protein